MRCSGLHSMPSMSSPTSHCSQYSVVGHAIIPSLIAWAKVEAEQLSAAATPHRRLDVVDEVGFFPLDRFDAVCIDPRGEYLNCQ